MNYSAAYLFSHINASSLNYIRDFSHRNYPQRVQDTEVTSPNLPSLMSHSDIATNVGQYKQDARAAALHGIPMCLGRQIQVNNSHLRSSYEELPAEDKAEP
jgi:hypothetical protein